MITVTMPWWVWVLYFLALGLIGHYGGLLGEKLGRATCRWYQRRLMEWSRRG